MTINNLKSKIPNRDTSIAVIGLGYVGLPLAIEFSKKYPTVGFDKNRDRISQLKDGIDKTLEVEKKELNEAKITYTTEIKDIVDCNTYIVTVPTPVDKYNNPDMEPLASASTTVGKILKTDDVVIYESTVYPGATEEFCVPILEKESGLTYNTDFFCGYSPERINPGDKEHSLKTITKITSGSNKEIADFVDQLYSSIVPVGTYKASSIAVAEAAKVIENVHRHGDPDRSPCGHGNPAYCGAPEGRPHHPALQHRVSHAHGRREPAGHAHHSG